MRTQNTALLFPMTIDYSKITNEKSLGRLKSPLDQLLRITLARSEGLRLLNWLSKIVISYRPIVICHFKNRDLIRPIYFYSRPGRVLQLAFFARAGRVVPLRPGKVENELRWGWTLGNPIMPVSPMYKPGLPCTGGISRLSGTMPSRMSSQTSLPSSDGRAGFTGFFGLRTTTCCRLGRVPPRLGRVRFPARQGVLA